MHSAITKNDRSPIELKSGKQGAYIFRDLTRDPLKPTPKHMYSSEKHPAEKHEKIQPRRKSFGQLAEYPEDFPLAHPH